MCDVVQSVVVVSARQSASFGNLVKNTEMTKPYFGLRKFLENVIHAFIQDSTLCAILKCYNLLMLTNCGAFSM